MLSSSNIYIAKAYGFIIAIDQCMVSMTYCATGQHKASLLPG